jgi:acetolactate synthase-1/2/3 large subunit
MSRFNYQVVRPRKIRYRDLVRSGAEYIVETLKNLGLAQWFILPGELNQSLQAALIEQAVPFIVPRHETAAVFMADGYYRHTGRLAVVCNAGGASALNLMAGLGVPLCESIPMVTITPTTSQASGEPALWHDLFADSSSTGTLGQAMRALTKANLTVTHSSQLPWMMERAHLLATRGRPGPVNLEIAHDVLTQETEAVVGEPSCQPHEPPAPAPLALERVLGLLEEKKVAVMAGRGVLLSRASDRLVKLAERLSLPVLTSYAARAAFPDSHPLALGILRLDAKRVAAMTEDTPDACIVLGASGWEWDQLIPLRARQIAHVNIDPGTLDRFPNAIGIVADCREFLEALLRATESPGARVAAAAAARTEWAAQLHRHPWPNVDQTAVDSTAVPIAPQRAIYELAQKLPRDASLFIDIGEFLALAIGAISVDRPGSVFYPIRPSHMGWALPAAIGASLTDRPRPMIVLVGDGGMLMTGLELATAAEQKLPLVVMVMNNGGYNSIRRGFEARFPKVAQRGDTMMWQRVDFAQVARGLGCEGVRAERPGDVARLLGAAFDQTRDRPLVVDAVIAARPDPPPELWVLRRRWFEARGQQPKR